MRRIHKFKTKKYLKLTNITCIEISDEVYEYMTEDQSDGVMCGVVFPQSPNTLMKTLEWFLEIGDEQGNERIRFIIRDLSSAVMEIKNGMVKLI